jgi:GNAT superfamily N-acetyltransferase
MKNKVVVRDCERTEIMKVQELVAELYYTDAGPRAHVPDVAVTYRALKAKPEKGRLVVFERGGELVGYAILIFFFSNEFAGDIVDIDEVLVTESARGEGIGRAFFAWIARTYKKAVGWSLQVRPGNKKARRLYESVGFLTSANLHLYNIFAWDEPHLFPGEAKRRQDSSRRNTTTYAAKTRSSSNGTKTSSGAKAGAKAHSRTRSAGTKTARPKANGAKAAARAGSARKPQSAGTNSTGSKVARSSSSEKKPRSVSTAKAVTQSGSGSRKTNSR